MGGRGAPERPLPSPGDRRLLACTPGYVRAWSGAILEVWSLQHAGRFRLNQTAGLVLLLCDGGRPLGEIKRQLGELFPGQDAEIDAGVTTAAAELLDAGLIAEIAGARPSLLVAFEALWPGFDPADNYFLRMLASRFDPLLVPPDSAEADVVFRPVGASPDPARRGRTRRVLVGLDDEAPDLEACDFAFSGAPVDERHAARHFRLPAWAIFAPWREDRRLPARYSPERACRHLCAALFGEAPAPQAPPTPVRAPVARHAWGGSSAPAGDRRKKLTIGMATYDDFDGVYFTVQALRLYHPEVLAEIEIVVVDNHPDGPAAEPLRQLECWIEGYRYLPFADLHGTSVRDLIFRAAGTDYVLCIDGHILIVPGALRRLIDFLDADPRCRDLLQGPTVSDDLVKLSTHFDPVWSAGMFGVWGCDGRAADPHDEPFEIAMQGLGLFACRKDAWPGFSPRFAGFGGEEGYLHEKFRQAGRRTLCLPFLRWLHRYPRPAGAGYPNLWEDRVRNYLLGHHELGLDPAPAEAHFRGLLGARAYERIAAEVRRELASPFFHFEVAYGLDHGDPERWQDLVDHLRSIGLNRPRRFACDPASRRLQAHGAIVELAQQTGLESVVVCERAWSRAAREAIADGVRRLPARAWQVLLLADAAGTCGVAYHRRAYERARAALADGAADGSLESRLHACAQVLVAGSPRAAHGSHGARAAAAV